jgi:dihydroorotate dehydrogenase (fumarate)
MMCSALLKNGIGHVAEVLKGVESWMKEHDYGSVEEMKGIMSQRSSASSEAFERANYLKTLQSYR